MHQSSIIYRIRSSLCLTYRVLFWKVMRQSNNAIIEVCFPSTESNSKKRPETVRKASEEKMEPHTPSPTRLFQPSGDDSVQEQLDGPHGDPPV